MIQEAYVSDEVAKLLKEKGFDEPVTELNKLLFKEGEKPVLKITQQKAMKWLREVHEIQCVIMYRESGYYEPQIFCFGEWINDKELDGCFSYEDAVEAALKYVLENLI